MGRLITLTALLAVVVALAAPAASVAGQPVLHEHYNFTSDPYPDNWCGVDGTSVDTVHDQFKLDASGASIENANVSTVFTATASGKSMTIQTSQVSKGSALTDNGDGTFTFLVKNAGLGPKFTFADGSHLIDVGTIGFAITVDGNGEFVSFEVLYQHGQRPAGCATIVTELS